MYRLETLSTILCFTLISLCVNFELSKDEYYKKELLENVVDPLYASTPLSMLEFPSALQLENLSLNEKETPSTLQIQYVMVTSSSPLSASLSLPDSGTSGGSGRSTGNHRSYPPALQPGTWDRIKNACLRSWFVNKQALCWAMFVTKEMKRTFRSVESGVFKLLCWECQKSRSYGRLSMDDDGCTDAASTLGSVKVRRLDRVCAVSTLESVKMYSVANCAQTCQTTAYSQLLAIILLTAGLSRGLLEVNKLSFSEF
jgi:hypothetical protein